MNAPVTPLVIDRMFEIPKALDPVCDSFYSPLTDAGFCVPIFWGNGFVTVSWAISSAVEHFVDIEGVTSSILVSPTTALRARQFCHVAY